MPATLNLQTAAGYATSDGGTATVGPINFTGTIVPVRTNLTLLSGNNAFTVPTGAIGALIVPPTTNNVVLKAKTTVGDVGLNIPQATPSLFLFDPANLPATFYINAAALTVGNTTVLFF